MNSYIVLDKCDDEWYRRFNTKSCVDRFLLDRSLEGNLEAYLVFKLEPMDIQVESKMVDVPTIIDKKVEKIPIPRMPKFGK